MFRLLAEAVQSTSSRVRSYFGQEDRILKNNHGIPLTWTLPWLILLLAGPEQGKDRTTAYSNGIRSRWTSARLQSACGLGMAASELLDCLEMNETILMMDRPLYT